jgi:positive regulator of sigma E activity
MNYAPIDDRRVIYHEGVAEEISEKTAVVRFVQNGACGSCRLQSICNPAEQKTRLIEAYHDGSIHPGQQVRICVEESVAWL